ncbi:MAG: hypothetical protein WAL25_13215, partial [Acidimicrobiia bacterium]
MTRRAGEDRSQSRTALTMQIAIGFTIPAATIWIVPLVDEVTTWSWAFATLALATRRNLPMLRLKARPRPPGSPAAVDRTASGISEPNADRGWLHGVD